MKNSTIHKFALNQMPGSYTTLVELPVGAVVLNFNFQNGAPFIWCLVDADPNVQRETRHFAVFGTGWVIETIFAKYIGTTLEGIYVWHCYEIINSPQTVRTNVMPRDVMIPPVPNEHVKAMPTWTAGWRDGFLAGRAYGRGE